MDKQPAGNFAPLNIRRPSQEGLTSQEGSLPSYVREAELNCSRDEALLNGIQRLLSRVAALEHSFGDLVNQLGHQEKRLQVHLAELVFYMR